MMSHRRMVDQTTKENVSSEHREIFTAKYTLDGGTIPVTLVPDGSSSDLKLGGTNDVGPVNLQMIIIDKRILDNNMIGFAEVVTTGGVNTLPNTIESKSTNQMSDIMGEIARMISDKMSADSTDSTGSTDSSESARSNFGILGTNTLVQGITLQLTIGDPATESQYYKD